MAFNGPRLFTKNYIDSAATLVASTGQATAERIFDRDTELKWQSVGSDDVTQETLEVDFLTGGAAISRTIDTLIIFGHNLKNFSFEYWNGAAFVALPGTTVTGETEAYTILSFTPVSTEKIKLLADTTQVVDDEKQVGEIWAFEELFDFGADDGPNRLGIRWTPTVIAPGMFDGGVKVSQLRWAGNRVRRYTARLGFVLFLKASYDTLQAAIDRGIFAIYPEPGERPQELFQVTGIMQPWEAEYSDLVKSLGYTLQLEVVEV